MFNTYVSRVASLFLGLFRISPHLLNVINTFGASRKNRGLSGKEKGLEGQPFSTSGATPTGREDMLNNIPKSLLGIAKHSFSDFGILNHTPLCVAAKSGREVLRKMLLIQDDSDEHMVNTSPVTMDSAAFITPSGSKSTDMNTQNEILLKKLGSKLIPHIPDLTSTIGYIESVKLVCLLLAISSPNKLGMSNKSH